MTSKEIAKEIHDKLGVTIDKRKIVLKTDIKTYGTYECEIKLYNGISAKVFVSVSE